MTGWEFREGVADILQSAGVDAGHIDTLLLTHLHYDHADGMRTVPNARVVVQRKELAYWTGPDARRISREEWLAVIASDASHFFENVETDRPGTILHDMPEYSADSTRPGNWRRGPGRTRPRPPGDGAVRARRGVLADRIVRIA